MRESGIDITAPLVIAVAGVLAATIAAIVTKVLAFG